ncbi:syntaxin-132-like [Dendrobium catenatum]|uniref:syntaxin-132-like n=1 Tax=Dendrobium catenatum TaxID=906689 RepID=UPI0010A0A629|nr:syntaxin-132-like [Dendrobium catenatum]
MNNLLTDSFELPRGQSSREGDVELGLQGSMHSSELGMEGFFKQVQEIDKQIEKLSKLLTKLQVRDSNIFLFCFILSFF